MKSILLIHNGLRALSPPVAPQVDRRERGCLSTADVGQWRGVSVTTHTVLQFWTSEDSEDVELNIVFVCLAKREFSVKI